MHYLKPYYANAHCIRINISSLIMVKNILSLNKINNFRFDTLIINDLKTFVIKLQYNRLILHIKFLSSKKFYPKIKVYHTI